MLNTFAKFFSIIGHPLLILTYILLLLLWMNPYQFGVYKLGDMLPFVVLVFLSTFALPAFACALMVPLGFINSLSMKDPKERIGPYIATGIAYLWMFQTTIYNPNIPIAFKIFILGATISLFLAFFINNFSKISIHAVGMGGMVGMMVIAMYIYYFGSFNLVFPSGFGILELNTTTMLMAVIILAGIVGTSRLILKAHEPSDLYGGYLVGFCAQFIALRFLL